MTGAVLISQLLVAPVLVFEAWCYLLLARRADAERRVRPADWAGIAVAAGVCAALLPVVLAHPSGANDRIWLPVLSVLTSFFAFPGVLLAALWLRARRRAHRDVRSPAQTNVDMR